MTVPPPAQPPGDATTPQPAAARGRVPVNAAVDAGARPAGVAPAPRTTTGVVTATGQPGEVVLETEKLTKHFRVRRSLVDVFTRNQRVVHAVDEVDLTLRRGQVTALV